MTREERQQIVAYNQQLDTKITHFIRSSLYVIIIFFIISLFIHFSIGDKVIFVGYSTEYSNRNNTIDLNNREVNINEYGRSTNK